MLVRTSSVDLWVPVGEEGVTVGRSPENDVVLHSPAVSHRHLRLVPTPDGMEVCDLGSTNPARYRGREVRERVVATYGDSLDVCGCVLTMTGPAPARP
ncbi:FHA domain-containing protein [Olsenella profusa]|uniref:FHA domain-containing protein n=2 Tax=Olsenella profusa TaxID=138595 RepID=A0ABS2F0D6_9ACTN|nr:FHA domain-containing protein [Olsenella profusa]